MTEIITTENTPTKPEITPQKKNLEITDNITKHLLTAGKWSRFLAILGFIFLGLMVVAAFIMGIILTYMPIGQNNALPFPAIWIGFIYLLMAIIFILPLLYLYRFSTFIKRALVSHDQKLLLTAFRNLKAHYRFISILIIVLFFTYLVAFIVMLFVGLFTGFSSGVPSMNA